MRLYALTVFFSAFLLFQVQPLIGKFILPWFGSSPGVWTTLLLFFQLLLLAGYAYAHLLARTLSSRSQACLHLGLLLACVLLLLPITPSDAWKPEGAVDPTWRILLLLSTSVGGPFLLLSSTSPLLQHWLTRIHPDRSPYPLYAVSNAGSLLALLTYPFLFEPYLRLHTQTRGWSVGFATSALLAGLCAWPLLKRLPHGRQTAAPTGAGRSAGATAETSVGAAPLSHVILWLALAACGSTVLLATTNLLGQEVPPVPFLFVLPLSLYLGTFIITFDHERWYYRPLFCVLLPLGISGAYAAGYWTKSFEFGELLALYSFALVACCMSCHGELVRIKPAPEHLTLFYLMVALGGALGGVFAAVLAPRLFDGFWEYEIGLITSYGLVMSLVGRDLLRRARRKRRRSARPAMRARRLGWTMVIAAAAGVVASVWPLARKVQVGYADGEGLHLIAQSRSFFGALQVIEAGIGSPQHHMYDLLHGHVKHGSQYLNPAKRTRPTSYYGKLSGIGLAIENHPDRSLPGRQFRIGVIGLGAGTLATYANEEAYMRSNGKTASDYLRFYEIDPEVVRVADEYFTFMTDALDRGADVDTFVGDARIVMERQLREHGPQKFDVLAVDAFSGDAVPIHLLTKECFEIYRAHLEPNGILAIHVTSKFLNLPPLVRALAELNRMQARSVVDGGDAEGEDPSHWVLVTNNVAFLGLERVRRDSRPVSFFARRAVLWTDDFSSLFQVLK